jgi:hypothetical protein
MPGHINLHPAINADLEQPGFNLRELEPGSGVHLDLVEGQDHERSLWLDVELVAVPPEGESPEFLVLAANVPERTQESNQKFGLPNPDFVDERFLVRGACSWFPGYRPTMVSISRVSINRNVWLTFVLPGGGGMEYFPFVSGVELR